MLFAAAWNVWHGVMPEPATMAIVGLLALAVNASVALLLYAFRDGDANMKSVWLCSRNDAIGNIAVMLAAAGVFGTGTLWPDIAVAVVLGALGLSAGRSVIVQARAELNSVRHPEGQAPRVGSHVAPDRSRPVQARDVNARQGQCLPPGKSRSTLQ